MSYYTACGMSEYTSASPRRTGVFGLPTHYFIDREGVIRDRYLGPLKRDQMEQRIERISRP